MVRLSLCRCIATVILCTQCAGDTTYDVQIATTWDAEDQRLASMQVNFNSRPSLSCTNFENTTDPHVLRNRNAETRCIVRCKDGLRPLQSCHVVSAYVLAGGSVVDISARGEAGRHIAVVEGDGRAIVGRRLEWEAWDGCYTGSDKGMRLNIGVVADQGFYEINGNTDASVRAHITQLMAFASITFEEQMNVELVVADMLLPGSGTGGAKTLVEQKPKAGTGKCRFGWEYKWSSPMTTHFGNKYAVLVYLTDCHTFEFGGRAQGYGGACANSTFLHGPQCVVRHRDAKSRKRPGYESDDETGGVRNEHKSDSKFILLHEIGHVVGAQHSFENRNYGNTSKGKGYGIMDYYTDGKWKDEVQFASKHKTHICKVFKDMRSSPRRENCFTEGLTPTTTPASTTPVPATNPTPTTPSDVTTTRSDDVEYVTTEATDGASSAPSSSTQSTTSTTSTTGSTAGGTETSTSSTVTTTPGAAHDEDTRTQGMDGVSTQRPSQPGSGGELETLEGNSATVLVTRGMIPLLAMMVIA